MTLKTYIWGMRIVTLISLAALGAVVYLVDPERSGIIGRAFFYAALFFALSGIFNLFFLFLRRKMLGGEAAIMTVGLSFRQGILLSILSVALLVLQSFRMLLWWDGLLVVAGIFLVELYFLSRN